MDRRGVTLFETILVLTILAIGASMAVPKFSTALENKRADSAIEGLRTLSHCMRLYMHEKNTAIFKNSVPLSKLSTGEGGNGCYDPAMLEPTYEFFKNRDVESDVWGPPWDDWVTIVACDKKKDFSSTRVIYLRGGGFPDRNSWSYGKNIYDYRNAPCPDPDGPITVPGATSKLFRQLAE